MDAARHGAGLALALLLAAAGIPAAAQADGPFGACEAAFAAAPDDWKECGCFYAVASRTRRSDEAIERLEGHLTDRPGNLCLALTLGRLRLWLGAADEAAPLLRQASDGHAARGHAAGEVYSRINLAEALAKLGASGEELVVELGRARRVAEEEADPVLLAEVAVKEAKLLSSRGGDVGWIEDSLREIRLTVFDVAHPSLQRDVLHELAKVLYSRGRFTEAEEIWTEAIDVTVAAGDGGGEAAMRASLAAAVSAQPPFPEQRERVNALLEEAIDAAVAAGNRPAEIEGRKRLARLLGGEAGLEQIGLAIDLAGPLADHAPALLADALATSALLLLPSDPAEARRRVDEAAVLLARVNDPWDQVHSWANRLHVLWETGPRDEALAVAESLLAIVDRLEEIQSTESARAEVSAVWTEIDQWLAGRLLLDAEASEGAERDALLERAFAASERMRARRLLESLAAGNVGPADAANAGDRAAWIDVQRGIVSVHRRLLDPSVSRERRGALLDELRELEALEDRLAARRRQLRKAAITEPGTFLTLDGLRAGLGPDEAVLAFQTRPWRPIDHPFGGGSWLSVITAGAIRVHRLPDPSEITPAVGQFVGLFEGREGGEAAPAAALYELLLGPALAELPEGVERLVVIPDGALHHLPFVALRDGVDGPFLAERYEVFVTPSATAWERLRGMSQGGKATLALADPETLVTGGSGSGGDRAWVADLDLAPLPQARREGRSALRRLGRPGRLLLGGEASEAAVKRGLRDGVCLLHLGTHAWLDERYPQRSAVLLAPGGPDEDGWLRPREAADLDLGGAVVVLASCQSAQGRVLSGEGALSLSRAFLEGGARTVVGTLWPIVDHEAADVFERFYWHLGRGETVAGALALAQRESLEAGVPAAAWAGLVVMGDGTAVVVPEPRPYVLSLLAAVDPMEWALGLATLALLLALGSLVLLRARSRRRAGRAELGNPVRPIR